MAVAASPPTTPLVGLLARERSKAAYSPVSTLELAVEGAAEEAWVPASLVATGDGSDYDEGFSPMPRIETSLQTIIASPVMHTKRPTLDERTRTIALVNCASIMERVDEQLLPALYRVSSHVGVAKGSGLTYLP